MKKIICCLLFSLHIAAVFSQVVINEIMLAPGSTYALSGADNTDPCKQAMYSSTAGCGQEWIEIYNSGCTTVDISCWSIGGMDGGTNGGVFSFPAGTTIGPNAFITLGGANSGATFNLSTYMPANGTGQLWGSGATRWHLTNGDGWLILYDQNKAFVDGVWWTFSTADPATKIDTDPSYVATMTRPTPCGGGTFTDAKTNQASMERILFDINAASDMGKTFARTTDAGGTWMQDATPTPNNCNGVCVTSSGFALNATIVQPSCGNDDGSISFAPSPSGTYFYTWPFPSNWTVSSVSNLAPGTYPVTITNDLGCSIDTTIVLTDIPCGNTCNPNGNLIIYSNYDGGILTINVDQNIPNLKVGICTYEPIQVTFTGPFVGNITQVIYAGMNSNQNNNNCGLGNFPTSVTGVPAGIVTISPPMSPPLVGYTPVHGNGAGPWGGQMIGVAGLCDTTVSAGGGNTPDEVVYYFLNATGGTLLYHQTQYACWMNETVNVTAGGNCCILPPGSTPCPAITSTISGQTNVLCNGQSTGAATVTANGGIGPYTYTWTPGNLNGGTQSGLAANVYTVNIVDANLCPGTATVTITQPAALTAPTASVTEQPTCSVATGTITVTSPTPAAGTTYTVAGTAPVVAPQTNTTGIFSGLAPGTYSVMATVNGCNSPLTSLTVNAQPAGPAAPTASVTTLATCSAPTATITVTVPAPAAGTTYTVTGTSPVVAPQTNTTGVFSGLNPGTYNVTTTVGGCTSTATVIVVSPPAGAPTISVVSTNDVTCNGGSDGDAVVSGSGGTGTLTYTWTPGNLSGTNQTGLSAGSYTVQVTDQTGCSNSTTVTIGEPAAVSITETITSANCGSADGSISVVVSGGTGTYTYSWSPGGSTASSITALTPGNYSVSVTDQSGCSTTENYVVGQIGSLAVVATPPSSTIDEGDSVQLNVTGGTTYSWAPTTGLSCSTCDNPIASPLVTTTYIVTGTDASRCTGADTLIVIVTPYIEPCGELFIPTVLAPDGTGSAQNKSICVYGGCVSELTFAIYSRWGEKIFETTNTDLSECWDGTYKGKPMNAGVFAYKLIVTLTNGENLEESGNITLIR